MQTALTLPKKQKNKIYWQLSKTLSMTPKVCCEIIWSQFKDLFFLVSTTNLMKCLKSERQFPVKAFT